MGAGANPARAAELFREIQRILASSKGPVNIEMATQVGTALATQEGDAAPDDFDDVVLRLDTAVHNRRGQSRRLRDVGEPLGDLQVLVPQQEVRARDHRDLHAEAAEHVRELGRDEAAADESDAEPSGCGRCLTASHSAPGRECS